MRRITVLAVIVLIPGSGSLARAQSLAGTQTVPDAAAAGIAPATPQPSVTQYQRAQSSMRVAALRRPVSVELQDSPVRQAAQTISHATGLMIHVAEPVPTETRLTVVAREVPLATVLDTIARQSGLLIAPYGNGSDVELKPAPAPPKNGTPAEVASPFAPWTREWGMNPSAGIPSPESPRVAFERQFTPAERVLIPRIEGAPPRSSEIPSMLGLPQAQAGGLIYSLDPRAGIGPLSVTGLSDHSFVVAQPAPGGEPALLLTLFRVEGGQLRAVSSIMHRLGASPRSAVGDLTAPRAEDGAPGSPGEATPLPSAP